MREEQGIALVTTVLAMLLLSAVGAALVLATSADSLIAANTGASIEAFYAADAVFERTVAELAAVPDLTSVLDGTTVSAFRDGAASGSRQLPDGSSIDLSAMLNGANCGKSTPCTEAELDRVSSDRPWGGRNPRWRLFSYGALDEGAGGPTGGLPLYVVSMVADDPAETDGNPSSDGGSVGGLFNPGAGVALLRAEAYGRRGSRRIVEGAVSRFDLATLARWNAADPATRGPSPAVFPLLQVVAWREVR